ncbi:MAG: aminotransferase class V-fold PLP-dependent enzyme, partial [Bacteroidetes bacterium]|nr:aminotransferase class V-fold PLP-dependent enzyme [Bacteroidota bacterium]
LIREDEQALSTRALIEMKQIKDLNIYGLTDSDSPKFAHKLGVIVFNIKNKMPSRVAKQLAYQSGIGVRYGCHCAHLIVKHILHISPFLEQFQRVIQILFPRFRFMGIIRVSLGIENTEKDVDKLISVLTKITSKKRGAEHKVTNGEVKLTQTEVQQQIEDFVLDAAKRVYL